MPGVLHQGILELFKADPWLAFDIHGIPHPVQATPIDRPGFPDLVLVARDRKKPKRGVVITVEAQNDLRYAKRWRIPVYQALLAELHKLPTWVVVVSFSQAMSRALRRWGKGPPPRVDALILDAKTVSTARWLDPQSQRPMAAVLAAALHGRAGDVRAAHLGLRAIRGLNTDERRRHTLTILAALPKPQRDQLMGELPVEERDELMEIERQSGTYHIGVEAGLQQGREQGLEQGRAALAQVILTLLSDRGVDVDATSEGRIRECDDSSVLQRWARQAAQVNHVGELFDA